MKWWPKDIEKGDIIRIKLNSIYHYGIYISDDEVIQFGLPPILNKVDQKDVKVLKTDIYTFSCDKEIEVLILDKKEKKKSYSKEEVVNRALSRLGDTGYNIIHNNCEHFVFECLFGFKFSLQEEEMRKKWSNMPYLKINIYEDNQIINKNIENQYFDNKSFEKVFKKNNDMKIIYYYLKEMINDYLFLDIKILEFKKDKLVFFNDSKKMIVYYQILKNKDYFIIGLSNYSFNINTESIDKSAKTFKLNNEEIYVLSNIISFINVMLVNKDGKVFLKSEDLK